MKRLDELGVSPAPWRAVEGNPVKVEVGCYSFLSNPSPEAALIAGLTYSTRKRFLRGVMRDARLIAAAPDLYKAMHEAVIEACHECDACDKPDYRECRKVDGECFVQEWRKVLAKAGGAK